MPSDGREKLLTDEVLELAYAFANKGGRVSCACCCGWGDRVSRDWEVT